MLVDKHKNYTTGLTAEEAVPRRRSNIGLLRIVVSLSMTSNEEKLVGSITRCKLIKVENHSIKLLPLRQVCGNAGVSLVDETEVRADVVECAGVRCVQILQEVASDGTVYDVLGRSDRVVEARGGRCGV